jgi:hypothetical protein
MSENPYFQVSIHFPNPTAHLKEDFARVILHFENGEYRNPEWVHFKTVPAVVQSARDYLARAG